MRVFHGGVVKLPTTATASANGAQTRNVHPPASRTAPMPWRGPGARTRRSAGASSAASPSAAAGGVVCVIAIPFGCAARRSARGDLARDGRVGDLVVGGEEERLREDHRERRVALERQE